MRDAIDKGTNLIRLETEDHLVAEKSDLREVSFPDVITFLLHQFRQ